MQFSNLVKKGNTGKCGTEIDFKNDYFEKLGLTTNKYYVLCYILQSIHF